jgi:hypothetical protein
MTSLCKFAAGDTRCIEAPSAQVNPLLSVHAWFLLDVERQGDLLGDSRTAPVEIVLRPVLSDSLPSAIR